MRHLLLETDSGKRVDSLQDFLVCKACSEGHWFRYVLPGQFFQIKSARFLKLNTEDNSVDRRNVHVCRSVQNSAPCCELHRPRRSRRMKMLMCLDFRSKGCFVRLWEARNVVPVAEGCVWQRTSSSVSAQRLRKYRHVLLDKNALLGTTGRRPEAWRGTLFILNRERKRVSSAFFSADGRERNMFLKPKWDLGQVQG